MCQKALCGWVVALAVHQSLKNNSQLIECRLKEERHQPDKICHAIDAGSTPRHKSGVRPGCEAEMTSWCIEIMQHGISQTNFHFLNPGPLRLTARLCPPEYPNCRFWQRSVHRSCCPGTCIRSSRS